MKTRRENDEATSYNKRHFDMLNDMQLVRQCHVTSRISQRSIIIYKILRVNFLTFAPYKIYVDGCCCCCFTVTNKATLSNISCMIDNAIQFLSLY